MIGPWKTWTWLLHTMEATILMLLVRKSSFFSNDPPDDPQLLPVKIEMRGLMTHNTFKYNVHLTSHLTTHCFSVINVEDQTYDPHTIFFQ